MTNLRENTYLLRAPHDSSSPELRDNCLDSSMPRSPTQKPALLLSTTCGEKASTGQFLRAGELSKTREVT